MILQALLSALLRMRVPSIYSYFSNIVLACEFLGGKIVTLFGLNEPKYQYAIDEYYRTQKEVKTKMWLNVLTVKNTHMHSFVHEQGDGNLSIFSQLHHAWCDLDAELPLFKMLLLLILLPVNINFNPYSIQSFLI